MQNNPHPIPPLPLLWDKQNRPHLIFDNSTIEKLRCPRLLYYEWLRKRTLVANKAGRNFGSGLHVGWATRFRKAGTNKVSNDVLIEITESMREWFKENPQPVGDFRNFDHSCRVVTAYLTAYPVEDYIILSAPDGKSIVESSFLFPLGEVDGILIDYAGKIDEGVQNSEGIFSFDHKSTFQFGSTFSAQMQMDNGQLGYCWALGQALGRPATGYIIDAVRIRKPTKKMEYSDAAPVDSTDFQRMPFYVSPEILQEWQKNTLALVHTVLFHHGRGYFPMHRWNCTNKYGTCDMFDVCSSQPSDREEILAGTLYEDNTWSPLNQAKESEENK